MIYYGSPMEIHWPAPARPGPAGGIHTLRILIADDQEITRRGVRSVIERHDEWDVCGEAASGDHALAIAVREQPDIAILAVSLPILSGIALTRRLQRESPSTSVLLFSGLADSATVAEGLTAGALGHLLKADSVDQLETALHALAANKPYLSPRLAAIHDVSGGR
jgi:DNA-binding NarL/FixJ family response regulator